VGESLGADGERLAWQIPCGGFESNPGVLANRVGGQFPNLTSDDILKNAGTVSQEIVKTLAEGEYESIDCRKTGATSAAWRRK
jgi:hypothetical protein